MSLYINFQHVVRSWQILMVYCQFYYFCLREVVLHRLVYIWFLLFSWLFITLFIFFTLSFALNTLFHLLHPILHLILHLILHAFLFFYLILFFCQIHHLAFCIFICHILFLLFFSLVFCFFVLQQSTFVHQLYTFINVFCVSPYHQPHGVKLMNFFFPFILLIS